ncbi:hypothetical protein C8F01DRAFT_1226770 [Mycena amicta]|nr:hypothetical protein C8F01DRAFT_1226770 [Mycena amicta]
MSSLTASSFQSKIDSFFVPSEAEMLEIQSLLEGPTAELAKHDEEIADLEATLARRRAHREALRLDISLHDYLDHDATSPPETSMLPASLSVHCGFSDVFKLWISRVSNCPLSVSYIQQRLEDWGTPDAHFPVDGSESTEIFRSMLALHDQLESLEVRGDATEWNLLLTLRAEQTPALKHIDISVRSSERIKQPFERAAIFEAPELTSIFLEGYGNPLALPCRWVNLLELSLLCRRGWTRVDPGHLSQTPDGGLDQNGLHEILRRCPNLVRAEFGMTLWTPRNFTSPLYLRNLEWLSLVWGFGHDEAEPVSDIAQLLQLLTIPKLRVFELTTEHGQGLRRFTLSPNILPNHLAVCFHPDFRGYPLAMLEILAALPQTMDLCLAPRFSEAPSYLWIAPLEEQFFVGLTTQHLCPLLKHLHILLPSSTICESGLLEFVHSRFPVLKLLYLETPMGHKIDAEEELLELAHAGLSLQLRYPEPPLPTKWRYDPLRGL